MININKGESNTVITSVNQLHTDDDYEIRFNNSGYIETLVVKDTSDYPIRYNKFTFIEGTDITLSKVQGDYEIVLDSKVIGKGIYSVIDVATDSDVEFEDTINEDIEFE